MTVILVLLTFLVFVILDYALNRGKAPAVQPAAPRQAAEVADRRYVEGFLMPEHLRYHPGHAWLYRERRNLARVGVDEFAARLAGKIEKIELPKPGQWIRQGQKVWALFRNGEKTEMVSPTEGEVIEVNTEVLNNPELLRAEPYRRGWLMTVHVPDEEGTTRNLVPAGLVTAWMRGAVERLLAMQPQLAGATLPDGGRPAEDLLEGVPEASWNRTTAEFFLTSAN